MHLIKINVYTMPHEDTFILDVPFKKVEVVELVCNSQFVLQRVSLELLKKRMEVVRQLEGLKWRGVGTVHTVSVDSFTVKGDDGQMTTFALTPKHIRQLIAELTDLK